MGRRHVMHGPRSGRLLDPGATSHAPDRRWEVVREGRDRDHEREVEEQLELARRAVRLVGRAREHPDADLHAHMKHRPDCTAVL
jgi:hypothetical protein